MIPLWMEIKNLKVTKRGILTGRFRGNSFRLDLNRRLGNNDGNFDVNGKNFADSAEGISVSFDGTLNARLYTSDGFTWNIASINLDKIIESRGNEIVFIRRRRSTSRRRTSPRRRSSPRRKNPIVIQPGANIQASCTIL